MNECCRIRFVRGPIKPIFFFFFPFFLWLWLFCVYVIDFGIFVRKAFRWFFNFFFGWCCCSFDRRSGGIVSRSFFFQCWSVQFPRLNLISVSVLCCCRYFLKYFSSSILYLHARTLACSLTATTTGLVQMKSADWIKG